MQFEVETILNGKHRDFNVDEKGALLVVEEEATLESFPVGAKIALSKAIEGGKGAKFELVTKNGKTLYEAEFKNKAGVAGDCRGHRREGVVAQKALP